MVWLDGTCYVRGCKSDVKYLLFWTGVAEEKENKYSEEDEFIILDAREVCENHEHIRKAALDEVVYIGISSFPDDMVDIENDKISCYELLQEIVKTKQKSLDDFS